MIRRREKERFLLKVKVLDTELGILDLYMPVLFWYLFRQAVKAYKYLIRQEVKAYNIRRDGNSDLRTSQAGSNYLPGSLSPYHCGTVLSISHFSLCSAEH